MSDEVAFSTQVALDSKGLLMSKYFQFRRILRT